MTERPSLVGAVLAKRYRLARKIGEGGMGDVYLAEPLDGAAPVAVKILHAEFMTDIQVASRFIEEGITSKQLSHPNIVRVIEASEAEDGTPFIVMELLSGTPLASYTENGGRVPLDKAVNIIEGVLAALAAAHERGVVHRDLKPGNVFLSRDSFGQFTVKLLDFGIAKVMDRAGGMGKRTRTGMLLGTPAYMSPEQIKSAKDVDHRSDLWSVAVLFYEMVTGRPAFTAPTDYARLAAVLMNEPEPISRIDPALAPAAPFLERGLAKDRNIRYQSAREMAAALRAITPGEEPTASRFEGTALSALPRVPMYAAVSEIGHASTPRMAAATLEALAPARAGSHDTLASISLPAAAVPGGNPPRAQVKVEFATPRAQPVDGTLPSHDLPMLASRGPAGVPYWLAGLIAFIAAAAGFVAGFAAAKW
jgi:serine/threonine-protein kinase